MGKTSVLEFYLVGDTIQEEIAALSIQIHGQVLNKTTLVAYSQLKVFFLVYEQAVLGIWRNDYFL